MYMYIGTHNISQTAVCLHDDDDDDDGDGALLKGEKKSQASDNVI